MILDLPKYLEKKKAALAVGVRMGAAINAFAGDGDLYTGQEWYRDHDPQWQQGLWRDVNGNLLRVPWVRPPDPFPPESGMICTNHPLYLQQKFEEVDLAIAGEPYSFHIDDSLGTATILRGKPPGCFCRYCLDGFRSYLKTSVRAEKLRGLGITNLDAFDYGAYLRARSATDVTRDTLWTDFQDFQLERAVDNTAKMIERARQQRGEWIPVGANAPVVGWHIVFAPLLDYIAAEVGTDAKEEKFGAKPMLNYKMGEALGMAIAATGIYRDWVRLLIHDIPDLVRGWVAESYAMGGNFIVPHKEWGLVQLTGEDLPISTAYPADPEKIGPLYKFVRDYPELFEGYKPLAQVGLLYDYWASRGGFRGNEMPQTAGARPAALHDICLELASANIQFGMVVAGGGPFHHELQQEDLAPYDYLIANDALMVDGRQRELLDAWDRNGKLIRWNGIDSVRPHVEQLLEAEPAGDIWVLPRVIPGRKDRPLVCHVLNRAFDAKTERMVRHRAVKVRLHKKLFDGRPYKTCTLFMERRWPLELPLRVDGDMLEIYVPYLELWGVLQFT